MKNTMFRLAAVLPALIICAVLLTSAAYAQSVPLFISGHVTVNGQAVQGASVSAGNSHTTTDGSGFYQLTPSIANGSDITVTASYAGHQQSGSATQNMQGSATVDLAITYSTATPTPAPTPTHVPTAAPSGSGGSDSGPTVPTISPPTVTPTAAANVSANATVPSGGSNVTAAVSTTPLVHIGPEQGATAVPAPAAGLPGWFGQALPYLLVLLLLVVAGATGYYLGRKSR